MGKEVEKSERDKALDEQAKKAREEFFKYRKTHPETMSMGEARRKRAAAKPIE